MNIKSSICGIQHTCINFLIFLIITKIECWPVFKQDPCSLYLCYNFWNSMAMLVLYIYIFFFRSDRVQAGVLEM